MSPKRRDLITDSIGKLVWQLSVPGMLERWLFSLTGLLHAYWMGLSGDLALSAVMMGMTLRLVLISPMMGLSQGAMAVVARHLGAKEQRLADRAAMQLIVLIVVFIGPIMVLGQIMGTTFLRWMGAQGELHRLSWQYLRIILSGLLFMETLPTLNGVFRGAGRPEYALRLNMVNALVMATFEPLLVLGLGPFPRLGVRGAALAEVLASFSGVMAQIYVLTRGKAGLQIHWRDVRPHRHTMRAILKIALPTAVQRFSPNLGNAVFLRLVSAFGDHVLAAYSIVNQIFGFVQAPAMGFSSAAGAMVGQNLGAQSPGRSAKAGRVATAQALVVTLVLSGTINLFPHRIVSLFRPPALATPVAIIALRYALLRSLGGAWTQVMSGALSGAGDALSPMIINIGGLWLAQLPLCLLLAHVVGLGPTGLWLGIALSTMLTGLAMNIRFRQGRWRTIRL